MSGFFFFQAEDGIRDKLVTGVQTCALPIWRRRTVFPLDAAAPRGPHRRRFGGGVWRDARLRVVLAQSADLRVSVPGAGPHQMVGDLRGGGFRSGERRVGKECRSRWSPYHLKKKKCKIRR